MLVPDALRLRGEERYRRLLEGEGGAIDAGSYGRVYMAIDLATQREVALKRQPLPSSTAAREFATFRALAEYPHPNVITMLDSFVHAIRGQDFLYMAIELCDSSLWHLFGTPRVKHGRLDTAEVLRLVRGAATGLTHLHGLGITHGDISLKKYAAEPRDPQDRGLRHGSHGARIHCPAGLGRHRDGLCAPAGALSPNSRVRLLSRPLVLGCRVSVSGHGPVSVALGHNG